MTKWQEYRTRQAYIADFLADYTLKGRLAYYMIRRETDFSIQNHKI